MASVLKYFTSLLSDELWTIDTATLGKRSRRFVRFVKLSRITFGKFAESQLGFQCVALSYFVALAVIPLLAFIFVVSDGLGLSDRITDILSNLGIMNAEGLAFVTEKASNIINVAKSGGVGVISALMFFWTILWMMFQVERVFNNVWGIRKVPRKMYKRFSYYLLVLVLTPFIILLFGAGMVYYGNLTRLVGLDVEELRFLPKFITLLVFYIITVLSLSVMYKFIPAVKVHYVCALKSALFTAFIFVIFQYLYLETQVFVSRLNGVYGAIAAVPLFLIWLNFSWQIIIYGAELSYGFQNVDSYHIHE